MKRNPVVSRMPLAGALLACALLWPARGHAEAVAFDEDVEVVKQVWAHGYVTVSDDGAAAVRVESHSNGLRGAHIIGVVAFFDQQRRFLWGFSTPQCGVGVSAKYGGDYDEKNPRVCTLEAQIPKALLRRVRFGSIRLFNKPDTDLRDWLEEEAKKRVLEQARKYALSLLPGG